MAAKKVGELIREARTAKGLTQEKLAKAAGEKLTAADISKCERGEADLTTAQLKKIAVACGVTQTSLVNAPKNLGAAETKKSPAKTASKTATAKTAAKTTASKTTAAKTAAKTTAAKTTAAKTTAAKTTAAKTTAAKTTAKTTTAKTTAAKTTAKTTAAKTTAAKTAAAKTAAKKTAAKAAPKTPANANTSMKVTASEKKLIEAYRGSTSDRKKAALKLLNGEYGDAIDKLLSVTGGAAAGSGSESAVTSAADGLGDMLGNLLGGLLGGGK